MTPRARLAMVAVAVVVLVIAFVALSGSSDDDTTSSTMPASVTAADTTATTEPSTTSTTTPAEPAKPAVPVVRVAGGQPQGGVQRLEFSKGDQVRFRVRSDTADDIHLHGYDIEKSVAAGGTATFAFRATIDGRFEVELHHAGTQIATLEINP